MSQQRAQDRLSKICSHLTAQDKIHSLSVQPTSGADVSSLTKKSDIFKIHPAVKQALDEGKPVVALESTVLTHGLPYPQNEQVGKSLEQKVREQGNYRPLKTIYFNFKKKSLNNGNNRSGLRITARATMNFHRT